MISINQYIQLIENFFHQHKQINTVSTSDEFNFNADSDIIYPVAHIEYVTQNITGDNISHQFEIIIADLFDPNITDAEIDIYNDCNLIATDFLDYFSNQNEDYEINENVNIQKFTNGNVDRVAGCVFNVSFNQFREANACIIPIQDNLSDDLIKMYYGVVAAIPVNFDGLSTVTITDEDITEATLKTGLNRKFAIAVNQAYSLISVTDLNASNLNITTLYEPQGSITKNTTVYNLYYFEQSINYSTNHNHWINIK